MFKAFSGRARKPAMEKVTCVPPGLRIYAIGDIHGCAAHLDRLHEMVGADLEKARPPAVHVVYLGDYINRGPDSKGVLDRLSQPDHQGVTRIFLKGNHEEMLLGFLQDPAQGERWCDLGGFETLLSYGLDPRSLLRRGGSFCLAAELSARLPPAHARFLSELQLSYTAGDYFLCHAGVRPGIPLTEQDPLDLMWIRHVFLDSDANHGKLIVHGHTSVDTPEICSNRINIDTGAYATGRLTALVLEGEDRRFLHT